ncbi:MAG TPA: hypothetical protein VJ373_07275, partial [Desulfatiglandales bacterium]|nr:hypothetical protein [Desulfatiglandales bacterium]
MINKQEIRRKTIITNIVPLLILLILFWRTEAYPSILEMEITFNMENTISIKGTFNPENIQVYNSKNKTVMYKQGVDYIITRQKEEVVIHRLEGGLIRPQGMVFVYINGKDKGVTASGEQSSKENIVAEINGESITYEKLLKQYNLFL